MESALRQSTRLLLALILTSFATSCVRTINLSECAWSRQITLSAADAGAISEDAVRQIAAHNRKVREFCR